MIDEILKKIDEQLWLHSKYGPLYNSGVSAMLNGFAVAVKFIAANEQMYIKDTKTGKRLLDECHPFTHKLNEIAAILGIKKEKSV